MLETTLRKMFCGLGLILALAGCNSSGPDESAAGPSTDDRAASDPSATDPATAGPALTVQQPRAHLMPGMGAVYLAVENVGSTADRLVSIETSVAKAAETHETIEDNGIMRMTPHPDGFEIPAGGRLELTPGGKHIMLIEPRELEEGETSIPLTLHFEHQGTVDVEVPVLAPGEMSNGESSSGAMDHSKMDHGAMSHGEMDHGDTSSSESSPGESSPSEMEH